MAELKASMRGPWVVEMEFNKNSVMVNTTVKTQHWFEVLDAVEHGLWHGATEVRIRPVKP